MANVFYSNFYLANEIEDQFNSHLDLQQFCTINNSLVGTPGMKYVVNTYNASNGTEKVALKAGNTKTIEVAYSDEDYTILTAQNRFTYYDEEAMTDPMVVPVGTRHMATDMFNTVMADIYGEFKNTSLTATGALGFGLFADAVATLNMEHEPDNLFGFVNPAQVAALRKALKDDLKYIEAFSRQGYIGSVCGVQLFTKKDATDIVIATKEAVTLFNKRGVEIEQERDANTRKNTIYSRKYYVAALTDGTKAVKLTVSP